MKRNLFYLLMLVCSMSVFTACSDNDEPNIPIETNIAGTYKGALDIAMNGAPLANGMPKNITIAKAGVSSVNLELKDFSFGGFNLGTITIQDCAMDKYRDRYTFTGSQTLKFDAPLGECPIVVNGTIVGNEVTANLDITVPALNQTVKVVYEGEKLYGGESSEAKITGFAFDTSNEANAIITKQPVVTDGNITFSVSADATPEQIKALTPSITISNKATLVPNVKVVDFNQPVTYTVVAENGNTNTYNVILQGKLKGDFEEWVEQESEGTSLGFYSPVGGYWDTSNTGVYLIKSMLGDTYPEIMTGPYAVEKTSDSHTGKTAAKISTIDSKGLFITEGFPRIPKVTAGTMFLGRFNTGYAFTNTLMCTRFGLVWENKPSKVTGYYKYIPGETYYRCDNPTSESNVAVEDDTKTDACMISAVLYEIENEEDSECLDGTNIYTSTNKIVASAQFSSAQKVSEYTKFELNLNYIKNYNPSKQYRFAVIASSSKDGDKFSGAPGSALYIDDVVVVSE